MAHRPALMRATDLSRAIWNGISDMVRRSEAPREFYFSEVVKSDPANNLIFVKDFGDVPIPLVAFARSFAYYDTVPTGVSGLSVTTRVDRREDMAHTNKNFLANVVCPSKGDVVVVVDPFGAKRFPFCVGVLVNGKGAWAES